jgi:hypothetical protein
MEQLKKGAKVAGWVIFTIWLIVIAVMALLGWFWGAWFSLISLTFTIATVHHLWGWYAVIKWIAAKAKEGVDKFENIDPPTEPFEAVEPKKKQRIPTWVRWIVGQSILWGMGIVFTFGLFYI